MMSTQANLLETMPEKFEEIKALFDAATVDEVPSNFETADSKSVEVWCYPIVNPRRHV